MNSPHLPGLPTISALIVAAAFVAWLGLWGPVNLDKLKEWQPLMAALVALGAGSLAYRGAMAKVNLDRDEAERRRNSERLGLFLRLRAALDRLAFEVEKQALMIQDEKPKSYVTTITISAQQLKLEAPKELADAWERIDLIPPPVVGNIENLRILLPLIASALERFHDSKWTISFPGAQFSLSGLRRPDDYLVQHTRRCNSIHQSCDAIIDEIERVIPLLRMNR